MVNSEKIKELMQAKSLKSKELALRVGVGETMMSYILNGLREPNVATLVRIARELGVTVDDLIVQAN